MGRYFASFIYRDAGYTSSPSRKVCILLHKEDLLRGRTSIYDAIDLGSITILCESYKFLDCKKKWEGTVIIIHRVMSPKTGIPLTAL